MSRDAFHTFQPVPPSTPTSDPILSQHTGAILGHEALTGKLSDKLLMIFGAGTAVSWQGNTYCVRVLREGRVYEAYRTFTHYELANTPTHYLVQQLVQDMVEYLIR